MWERFVKDSVVDYDALSVADRGHLLEEADRWADDIYLNMNMDSLNVPEAVRAIVSTVDNELDWGVWTTDGDKAPFTPSTRQWLTKRMTARLIERVTQPNPLAAQAAHIADYLRSKGWERGDVADRIVQTLVPDPSADPLIHDSAGRIHHSASVALAMNWVREDPDATVYISTQTGAGAVGKAFGSVKAFVGAIRNGASVHDLIDHIRAHSADQHRVFSTLVTAYRSAVVEAAASAA